MCLGLGKTYGSASHGKGRTAQTIQGRIFNMLNKHEDVKIFKKLPIQSPIITAERKLNSRCELQLITTGYYLICNATYKEATVPYVDFQKIWRHISHLILPA